MPVIGFRKSYFILLALFLLLQACSLPGRLEPDPDSEIVVTDPELTTQQAISECTVKANRKSVENKVSNSEVFLGFQKQESFGECMNAKGYTWGYQ